MSYACRHVIVLAASMLAPAVLLAEAGLVAPPDLKIGRNLQSFSGIKLTEPAPKDGLIVTVTSDDPSRLLLSLSPDQPGSKSIALKVKSYYVETPDFCVQALGDKGKVTFTVSAPGAASVKGKVTLTPSAILMAGPFKAASFDTTPGQISKITFYSAQVDPSGAVEQQLVAGDVSVDITSSNPKVGETLLSSVKFKAGEASAITGIKPAGPGSTTLTMKIPSGFSTPPKMLSVAATVTLPGIGLAGEINLGKDLQMGSAVLLGEAAPDEGLDVTLTSDDPKKLVISAKEDQLGSKSVTLHFAKGEVRANYYLQALSDSGTVNYNATAPGYRTRVAPVYLAPSGILVVYKPYGAADRADGRPFTTKLDSKKPVQLSLLVVYLDRDTHKGGDITAQALRPGVTPTVELKTSDPAVATVPTTVTLPPLSKNMDVDFTKLTVGKTVISVSTPSGFTTPDNGTSVGATVVE